MAGEADEAVKPRVIGISTFISGGWAARNTGRSIHRQVKLFAKQIGGWLFGSADGAGRIAGISIPAWNGAAPAGALWPGRHYPADGDIKTTALLTSLWAAAQACFIRAGVANEVVKQSQS